MKAIEFQSHLVDGKILVPAECGLREGQDVRVLILVKEVDGVASRPICLPKYMGSNSRLMARRTACS